MGESTSLGQMERTASTAEAPTTPEEFEFVSAADNPLAAMAAISQAGVDGAGDPEIPLIESPVDNNATMPGGLVHEGSVYKRATVRELNGEDEEFLARALAAEDFERYQQVLLERGVEKIGPLVATDELLDQLLIGDRDALILSIRVATYGPTLDLDVICMHCNVESKIRVDFTQDVPIKPLSFTIEQPYQTVSLRTGESVSVRLATGADARMAADLKNKTMAEINTEIMARCVESINGVKVSGKQQIRALGMGARARIVQWMSENQPGPEYDKVVHVCTVCRKETPLGLTTGDMFRG